MKPAKRKRIFGQVLCSLLYLLLGGVCGLLFIQQPGVLDLDGVQFALRLLSLILVLYLVMLLQVLLHETGHLIFGLLTGYKFSSFRIFGLMWIRQDGVIRFRRLSIAGTAGQCLMLPPEFENGNFPYIWYNLGGALLNLFSAVCMGVPALLLPAGSPARLFLGMGACIGAVFALTNGLPLRSTAVDNDGYNAMSMGKSPEALRAFWIQLKVNGLLAQGVPPADMPDDWFVLPSDEAMKNSMVAVTGVMACGRMMRPGLLEQADQAMAHLLSIESGIVGLHRQMMTIDRLYCELVGPNRPEVCASFLDKQQKKIMKAMRRSPSVLRTQYAYALLAQHDAAAAKPYKTAFAALDGRYPYPAELELERELMAFAEQRFQEAGAHV